MRIGLLLLTCALAVAVLGAQAPVRDGAIVPVPAGTAGIDGRVRDEAGRALRRATVVINGDMRLERSAITDDEGRFAFANLPAGRFTITASKAAYPSASYGAQRPNRPGAGVLLGVGQQVSDITVTLSRGAVITGRVFDDHGEPMPGVPVMPWEVRTALSGERTLDFPSTGGVATTTDDHGEFRFYGLPPGEYTVGTSWFYSGLEGNVRVPTDAEIQSAFLAATNTSTAGTARTAASRPTAALAYNYAKVFYPSSLDPMAASTVQLAAGEERNGMDIHMQFRPMSKLEVVLSGPEGAVNGARVTVSRTGKVAALNSSLISSTSATGRFESPSLGPGDYTVRIQTQANGDRPAMWATEDVTLADAEPLIVSLQLQPAMTVTGSVAFNATSQTLPSFANVRVSLLGVTPGTGASLTPAIVDASGRFSLDGVFPARFRVAANVTGASSSAWSVKSVTIDGRDVTDLPVDIRPGAAPSLLVTFTDEATELSGNLVDPANQPSTDYFVVVVPVDHAYWMPLSRRIASTRPDGRGHFVFRALPPGEYRLAATTDLVSRDLQEVGALEALAAQSLPFTLTLGEKKVIDIRVAGRQ